VKEKDKRLIERDSVGRDRKKTREEVDYDVDEADVSSSSATGE
jgi:hypothetical protein